MRGGPSTMTPKKIAGGAARFSLIGRFFGWVSFRAPVCRGPECRIRGRIRTGQSRSRGVESSPRVSLMSSWAARHDIPNDRLSPVFSGPDGRAAAGSRR